MIIIPVGFFAQTRLGGERVAGVHQLWAAALALGVAGLLATEFRYLALAAVVLLGSTLLVALEVNWRRFLYPRRDAALGLGVLAALGAGPWIAHALNMASHARALAPPRDAETNGFHHWTAASAPAICVVILLAVGAVRMPGWRVVVYSVAASGAVYGISSLLFPTDAGSGGKIGGGLALAWCAAVAATALLLDRRPDTDQDRP